MSNILDRINKIKSRIALAGFMTVAVAGGVQAQGDAENNQNQDNKHQIENTQTVNKTFTRTNDNKNADIVISNHDIYKQDTILTSNYQETIDSLDNVIENSIYSSNKINRLHKNILEKSKELGVAYERGKLKERTVNGETMATYGFFNSQEDKIQLNDNSAETKLHEQIHQINEALFPREILELINPNAALSIKLMEEGFAFGMSDPVDDGSFISRIKDKEYAKRLRKDLGKVNKKTIAQDIGRKTAELLKNHSSQANSYNNDYEHKTPGSFSGERLKKAHLGHELGIYNISCEDAMRAYASILCKTYDLDVNIIMNKINKETNNNFSLGQNKANDFLSNAVKKGLFKKKFEGETYFMSKNAEKAIKELQIDNSNNKQKNNSIDYQLAAKKIHDNSR